VDVGVAARPANAVCEATPLALAAIEDDATVRITDAGAFALGTAGIAVAVAARGRAAVEIRTAPRRIAQHVRATGKPVLAANAFAEPTRETAETVDARFLRAW
jgi:hypothetical protein